METETLIALGSIILIDLVLSGDNAIIIALASRSLPPPQQKKAIFWGCLGAIFFRVMLTFMAAFLLKVPYLQFAGGVALLYIAIRVLAPKFQKSEEGKEADNLWAAVKIILTADVIMSLDNILAVAGAADGNIVLLATGLLLSIPIVIFGSTFLANLMDKYPVIVYAGTAVLGWTAAKMIVKDASFAHILSPTAVPIEITLTVLTLAIGRWLKKRQERGLEKAGEPT